MSILLYIHIYIYIYIYMNNICDNIKCNSTIKKDNLCFDNTPADRKCIISDHLPVCIEKDGIKIVSFNIGKMSTIKEQMDGKILIQCSNTIIIDFFNKYLLLYNIICLQETNESFIDLLQLNYNLSYDIFHNVDKSLCILVEKKLHISDCYLLNESRGGINIRILELCFIYNSKKYIIYNCKYFYNMDLDDYMKNHKLTINLLIRIYHYFINEYDNEYENVLCILGDFNDNNIENVIKNQLINPYLRQVIGLLPRVIKQYNFSNVNLIYNPINLLKIMYSKLLINYMNYIYIILQIFSNNNILYRRRISRQKNYYNDYIFIINDNNQIKNLSYINIQNIINKTYVPKNNIYIYLFKEGINGDEIHEEINGDEIDEGIHEDEITEEGIHEDEIIEEGIHEDEIIEEGINTINMTNEEIDIIKNIIILLCELNNFLVEQSFIENPDYDSSKDTSLFPSEFDKYDKGEKLKKYIDIFNRYIGMKKHILEFFTKFNIIDYERCEISEISDRTITNLNLDSEKLYLILISYNDQKKKLEITESDRLKYIYNIFDIFEIFPLNKTYPSLSIYTSSLTDEYDDLLSNKSDEAKLSDIRIIIHILNELALKYYNPKNKKTLSKKSDSYIKQLNNINHNIYEKFRDILKKIFLIKQLIIKYIKNIRKSGKTLDNSSIRHKYLKYKYKYINLINNT